MAEQTKPGQTGSKQTKPDKNNAKPKAPRVKPGSLGWVLYGDEQTGAGSDPVDFIASDHVKRPGSDDKDTETTSKGGFVVEVRPDRG